MKKFLSLVLLLGIAAALFIYRPWADHSPIQQLRLFHPDYRLENLRNMDRVFPKRDIKAAATPFKFERNLQPLQLSYEFDGETRTLENFLERTIGTSFLVIQNDTIIDERYLNGGSDTDRFTSWSAGKSFVATLVGMALDEGLIKNLDDPITTYLPTLKGSAYDGVPIKHVLQMGSAIQFDETYGNRFADINTFFAKVFLLGQRAENVMASYPSKGPSGEKFDYVSMDTQALGMLVRTVFNKSLSKLMEERLWQPLGMERDAYWNIDKAGDDGVELAFCCLNASTRDYARFGRLYLNDGMWEGQRILPTGWVTEATTPGAAHLTPEGSGREFRGYQYQWWMPKNQERDYFASGVWGQNIYVSEPDQLIVVRTSVDPDYTANMRETVAVFRAIRDHLRNRQSASGQ